MVTVKNDALLLVFLLMMILTSLVVQDFLLICQSPSRLWKLSKIFLS